MNTQMIKYIRGLNKTQAEIKEQEAMILGLEEARDNNPEDFGHRQEMTLKDAKGYLSKLNKEVLYYANLMNEEALKELTLTNFINEIESLKGNDLKIAKRKVEFFGMEMSCIGEDFNNWMGDAFNKACEELGLDMDEIQETNTYVNGYYEDNCWDYIDELMETN